MHLHLWLIERHIPGYPGYILKRGRGVRFGGINSSNSLVILLIIIISICCCYLVDNDRNCHEDKMKDHA